MNGINQKDVQSPDNRDYLIFVPNPCSAPVPSSSNIQNQRTPVAPSSDALTSATLRILMNKVEQTCIITQLSGFGAPLQKYKTLDATCARVVKCALSHHVPDNINLDEQKQPSGDTDAAKAISRLRESRAQKKKE